MVKFSGNTIYFRASRVGLATTLFLFALCNSVFAAPGLKASLDRATVSLSESATLSLTFTDVSFAEQPALPSIPDFRIGQIPGVESRSSTDFITGQTSSQITYRYQLTPTKTGEFVIPAIRINVGGTVLTSQPLSLKVSAKPSASDQPEFAILRLSIPQKDVHVGEVFVALLEICFHPSVVNTANPQINPPPASGFTVGKIHQSQQTQTRIGNETYHVFPLQIPMTAVKSGLQKIEPAQCAVKVYFGPLNIFGQPTRSQNLNLVSEPQTLQVLPLPMTGQPPNFSGAIGNFSMSFTAAPTNLAVGDPITLKVQISGRGSLDLLAMPQQTEWREFKTYPATSKIESNDPLGLEGAKTFEQVVVPQNSEVKSLPPFVFSFFDPEQKKYRTLTHPAIPLTVRPTAATPQPTIFSSNSDAQDEQPSREIVHIKPQLGTIHASSAPLVQQPWFWVAQSLAPLFWIGSIMYRRQKEKLANNPKLRRQRAVEKIVREELPKLKAQANANQSDEFFVTVFHLLQEQIGERLDLPASSITEAVVDDELKSRGLNPNALALLHELFQTCNQVRYAPIRSGQQLASFVPKVEQALDELKKLKNENVPASV